MRLDSEGTDTGRSATFPLFGPSNTFGFKIEDNKGRMHRFNCGMLLLSSIHQRL